MSKEKVASCGYVVVIHETHYYIKSILEIISTGRNIQHLIFVQNHLTLTGMVLMVLVIFDHQFKLVKWPQLFELDLKHSFKHHFEHGSYQLTLMNN